jgi:hypothetical protein
MEPVLGLSARASSSMPLDGFSALSRIGAGGDFDIEIENLGLEKLVFGIALSYSYLFPRQSVITELEQLGFEGKLGYRIALGPGLSLLPFLGGGYLSVSASGPEFSESGGQALAFGGASFDWDFAKSFTLDASASYRGMAEGSTWLSMANVGLGLVYKLPVFPKAAGGAKGAGDAGK